jgi:diadenosine tetraphosphate (Ap4A) HIT family hydrolase
VLLVPKKVTKDFDGRDEVVIELLRDVLVMARSIVDEYDLNSSGYRLILNGGKYQEVPQLYFHLVADIESFQMRDYSA